MIIVTLAATLGWHWELLQSVAWVTMIARYSHTGSLPEAVAKTFDGKHPCALCKSIASGRQTEQKSDTIPTLKKFEFSYVPAFFIFQAPLAYWEQTPWTRQTLERSVAPPVPPPRYFPG